MHDWLKQINGYEGMAVQTATAYAHTLCIHYGDLLSVFSELSASVPLEFSWKFLK